MRGEQERRLGGTPDLASCRNDVWNKEARSGVPPRLSRYRLQLFRGRCLEIFRRNERAPRAKRQISLHLDEKVENPHPPFDRETVANVSAEDGIHCRRNLENVLWMEEYLDEFLRVPGVDEAQVNIHRLVNVALVTGEQFPASPRTIQDLVQSIGRLFARENGKENAAAENRIDETGCVA